MPSIKEILYEPSTPQSTKETTEDMQILLTPHWHKSTSKLAREWIYELARSAKVDRTKFEWAGSKLAPAANSCSEPGHEKGFYRVANPTGRLLL